jgi:hypothetical protein
VAELVDALDSKSSSERSGGSIPPGGTEVFFNFLLKMGLRLRFQQEVGVGITTAHQWEALSESEELNRAKKVSLVLGNLSGRITFVAHENTMVVFVFQLKRFTLVHQYQSVYVYLAEVVELVDTHVSEACAAMCAGSTPAFGTFLLESQCSLGLLVLCDKPVCHKVKFDAFHRAGWHH